MRILILIITFITLFSCKPDTSRVPRDLPSIKSPGYSTGHTNMDSVYIASEDTITEPDNTKYYEVYDTLTTNYNKYCIHKIHYSNVRKGFECLNVGCNLFFIERWKPIY